MRPSAVEASGTLVLFTVCAQAAVGVALVGGAVGSPGDNTAASVVALVLLGIAGLAALLHLRRPGRALRAIANPRTSPLSREILAGGVFAALLLAGLGVGDGVPGNVMRSLVLLAGVVFLHAMVQVYLLRTVPAWDALATTVSFYSTALVLGSACCALLGAGAVRVPGGHAFAWLAAAVIVIDLLVQMLHLHRLERRGGAAAESARVARVQHRGVWRVRIATALLGVGVLLAVAVTDEGAGWRRPGILLAVLLLFASELLGRWLFYTFHRRVGL